MEILDAGVLNPSFMDLVRQTPFAQSALHYVLRYGHFYCNSDYAVDRRFLDQFLLMYICKGAMSVETQGKRRVATAGQVVLLDCRQPHRYASVDTLEFLWFHFRGNNSEQYVPYITRRSGIVFTPQDAAKVFERILSCCQQVPVNEHMISLQINSILCRLAVAGERVGSVSPMEGAIQHIHQNFHRNVTVEELAAVCCMSKSHFIRSFRAQVSCTPHEYLLTYRLNRAKYLLLNTTDSVEKVGERCGFNSASHFARAFRAGYGMSPTEFRRVSF